MIFGGYQNTTPPCPLASSCVSADTWKLAGSLWTNVTPAIPTSTNNPAGRYGASMAYDSAIAEFVLFGGSSQMPNGFNNPALGDTWLFSPSNGTWTEACLTCVAGTDAPPARWDAGVAYDPLVHGVVLYGGLNTSSGATTDLSDTWTFNGTAWTKLTGTTGPSARSSPSMAWDGQTSSVILFGGVPAGATTDRTWSFSGTAWPALSPSSSPAPMGGAAAVTDPVNGSVTIIGGCATNPCATGAINESWSYTNGNWFRLVPASHPAPVGRDHEALFEVGPEFAIALFGGDARGLPVNDTWYWTHIEVGQVAATPDTVDLGQAIALRVNVSGGFGFDTLRWTNLPPGCATSNSTAIVCLATGSGPYSPSIRAVVSDEIGQTVYAPATLVHINADPLVSVTASPMTGIVPLQTSFFATTTGGTGTSTYAWSFGDHGIGIGPNPSHTFVAAGNFTATVWANDSLGVSSLSSVTVHAIPLLGINLAISPVTFEAGNSSVIAATGYGGVAPYSYAFRDLPAGCANTTHNESTCIVASPGTYRFSVAVSDQSGQTARANGTLDVSARLASAHSNAFPVVDWYLLGGGVAGGILLGLAGLFVYRRRSRRPVHRPVTTTVPVPEAHDLPAIGGSLYVPPPENKAPKRKP